MKSIYLDYAATTPVDPRVVKAMAPYFSEQFGNPGSLHSYGQKASGAVFMARQAVAVAIGADYPEVIFTASATEANNLALRGSLRAHQRITNQNTNQRIKPRIIISAIEHESILKTAKDLERDGTEVVIIPVSKEGIIDLKKLKAALNEKTALVSVMMANNETGVIQPIREIAKIIRDFKATRPLVQSISGLATYPLLHTDAAQAFNYLSCDVNELGVDLMTLSAQKIYGPKGVGMLYVRSNVKGNNRFYPIDSHTTGGGQEQGLRSGTENVSGIVGFAKAVEIAEILRDEETKRLTQLSVQLWRGIKKIFPKAVLNGPQLSNVTRSLRLPNNINIFLPGKSAEEVIVALDLQGIAISSGSACTARSPEPSHVLLAMGASKEVAKNSIRITLGRQTMKADLDLLRRLITQLK